MLATLTGVLVTSRIMLEESSVNSSLGPEQMVTSPPPPLAYHRVLTLYSWIILNCYPLLRLLPLLVHLTNICLSQPKWMQYVHLSIERSEHLSMQSRISAFLANDFSIYRSFSPHLSFAALHIFIAYHKPYMTSFLLPAA